MADVQVKNENDMTDTIESICVQITPVGLARSVSTILVACIYHPPWADQNGHYTYCRCLSNSTPFGFGYNNGRFQYKFYWYSLQSEVIGVYVFLNSV